MSEETFRVAVVGAGRMGRAHITALERSRRVDVEAVVEPVEPTRSALARRGLPVFTTVAELLAEGGIDGVLIAAPTDRHLRLVEMVVGAGLPVLCEKPVGMRAADAAAAAAAVDQAGVTFQVGYWRRFVPALRLLRERIVAGELGGLLQICCLQWDAEPPPAQFRAHSGGIAVDMAVHEFDQARWLSGQDVSSVTAMPGGGGDHSDGDPDVATIVARLAGGTLLTVSVGRIFPDGDCCWIEVFGTAGYERIPFMWGAAGDEVFHAALVAQAEAFAVAVRTGEAAGAGATDAVAALSAAELAGEALRDRSEREVPRA